MRMWRGVLAAVAVVALSAGSAQAQAFGIQGSWGDDSDLGIGARMEIGVPNLLTSSGALANTYIIGSFDYFFPDCPDGADCTYWELNANLAIPLVASSIDPYVGAGLNIAHGSFSIEGLDGEASDTDVGLNLLGGLRFPLGSVSAFGEARLELGGGEQFVLTFGALVGGQR